MIKPFSPMELVARIKAALRKREAPEWAEPPEPFVLGELTVDYAERRVTLAGRPVQLTAIEYGLLFELSANAGRVMTYDRLLRLVWGLRRSWATTPTTPSTSSTSPASATAWRRARRRDLRRGRDLQGLHWQCRVCRTLALFCQGKDMPIPESTLSQWSQQWGNGAPCSVCDARRDAPPLTSTALRYARIRSTMLA